MTSNTPFHERVARLEAQSRARKAKSIRVTYTRDSDGLMMPVAKRIRPPLPWKSCVLIVVCLIGLKGFLYARFGEDHLIGRAADLSAGSAHGGVALAFVLRPDPLSGWMAARMAPFVPGAVQIHPSAPSATL